MKKQKFTKLEALEDILETLKSYSGYIEDLHHEVFNTDYYIIGCYEAEEALKNSDYGIFGAIDKIQEYEKNQFGEVNTDLSSSEAVANMLYYIVGEETLSEVPSFYSYSGYLEDEEKAELIQEIEKMIENEK